MKTIPNHKPTLRKILQLFLSLMTASVGSVFAQTKQMQGDTVFLFKRNKELQKKLDLKDFETSHNDFDFRFWNHGQVIEISKDSTRYTGTITNYIYHRKQAKAPLDTLCSKVALSPKQSQDIYLIVHRASVLDLPSDNSIKKWKQGFDGDVYIIEHADQNQYAFKSYWTPTVQDSIPEALIVLTLIKNLSNALDLEQEYASFRKKLPRKGCYNSGTSFMSCYISNAVNLGYSGAVKLPLGFYASYNVLYIGKTQVNTGMALQYNFDPSGFHHLNFEAVKWGLFNKGSTLSDYIEYNYQNRKLNIKETKATFENHQVLYGCSFENHFGLGIGVDYVTGNYNKAGVQVFMSKGFSDVNINTSFTSSIFNDRINYKAELFKTFNLNANLPLHRIEIGLSYEQFMNYKDVYFVVRAAL